MKLFHKLVLLAGLMGMVPLVIGGVMLININRTALEDNIRQRQREAAVSSAARIRDHLLGIEASIGTVLYHGSKDLGRIEQKEVDELFNLVLTRFPDLTMLAFYDAGRQKHGEAIDATRIPPTSGALTQFLEHLPADLVRSTATSVPYVSQGGGHRIAVAIPYERDKELRGMVVAEISLERIQSIVRDLAVGARGHAFLVDAQGRLLAHREREMARQQGDFTMHPAVAAALPSGISWTGGYAEPKGEAMLGTAEPIERVGWLLVLQEPEADAFAASREMRNITMLLVAGVLLVATAGGMMIARSIVGPVHLLLSGTRRVAAGDLATRVDKRSGDEIGSLTDAFNSMTTSLSTREEQMVRIDATAKVLLDIHDLKTLLDRTVESFRQILDPSRLAVYLAEGETLVAHRREGWENGLPCPERWPAGLQQGVLEWTRARRESVLLNEAAGDSEFRRFHEPFWEGARHLLCVPLEAQERRLGYLCLHEKRDASPFSENDRRAAGIIAAAATAAMSNLRLLNQMVEKVRMEGELRTAELVQRNLLPRRDLATEGFEVAGHFQSASETGGDWYGYLHDPATGRVAVLIGDVTGHGVPAALMTASAHSFFQTLDTFKGELTLARADHLSPSRVLERLNRVLCAIGMEGMTMSFFVSAFDPSTGTMSFANAGHTFPYLVRDDPTLPPERRTTILSAQGPRLGEQAGAIFKESSVVLQPGDAIFWYTDGVVDCEGAGGERFDRKRLRRALGRLGNQPAPAAREAIVRELEAFRGGRTLDDDVTFVVGRVPPTAAGRPGRPADLWATADTAVLLEPLAEALAAQRITVRPAAGLQPSSGGPAIFLYGSAEPAPAAGGPPEVLVFDGLLDPHIAEAAVRGTPLHFLARSGNWNPRLTALLLRAAADGGTVALRSLLGRTTEPSEWLIHDSRDRERYVAEMTALAQQSGAREERLADVRQIAMELLTNAFYHSPCDEAGRPLYHERSRREPVLLDPRQACRVTAAPGEEGTFWLSVRDAFGRLDPATLLAHLRWGENLPRQQVEFDPRRPGSGLGLSLTYRQSRRMILNITPGRTTEVVCELDIGRPALRIAPGTGSLHVFVATGSQGGRAS